MSFAAKTWISVAAIFASLLPPILSSVVLSSTIPSNAIAGTDGAVSRVKANCRSRLVLDPSEAHAITNSATGISFSSVQLSEPAGRFLVPKDWQLLQSKGKLLASVVIRESDHENRNPRTLAQMSFNPVSNLSRMQHGALSRQLKNIASSLKQDDRKRIEHLNDVRFGDIEGLAIQFVALDKRPHLRVHRYYLADETADILYVVSFTATVEAWEDAWRVGRIMMTRFELGDSTC